MQAPIEYTIGELLKKIKNERIKFYIPGYQRGYKWTSIQATQLVDDLISYGVQQHLINPDGDYHPEQKVSAYYLQPIAICPRRCPPVYYPSYDIIDGQQRLTTIWLLLYVCFSNQKKNDNIEEPNYAINYESFAGWQDKFKDCNGFDSFKKKSLNHFHIYEVYKTFDERIGQSRGQNKKNKIKVLTLYNLLLNHVKIIWSDISSDGSSLKSEDIKTFTNLNSGKIPLTCGELIKGLVLQKNNYLEARAKADSQIVDEDLRLLSAIKELLNNSRESKQLYDRIAREWDAYERDLHDESLWHFIYNKESNYVFDTRLEYIFNLIEQVAVGEDSMSSFNKLYDKVKSNPLETITVFWNDVTKYIATIKEWYKDKEYYHLIGYLVATKPWITDKNKQNVTVISYLINGLYQENWDKSTLRSEIKRLILDSLAVSEDDNGQETDSTSIENLNYKEDPKSIRKLLLFFNIHTILMQEGEERFPFNRYKEESWDIEHIASQTDFKAFKKDTNEAKLWALYVLQYFTGLSADDYIEDGTIKKGKGSFTGKKVKELKCQDVDKISNEIVNAFLEHASDKNKKDFCNKLFNFLCCKGTLDNVDDEIKELGFIDDSLSDEKEKHKIGNLTLLNMSINRSYGNAIFPVKRMILQDEMQKGFFVPPCTQRVFQKAYSRKFDQLYVWSKEDAEAYTESIKSAIMTFSEIDGTYAEYKANR